MIPYARIIHESHGVVDLQGLVDAALNRCRFVIGRIDDYGRTASERVDQIVSIAAIRKFDRGIAILIGDVLKKSLWLLLCSGVGENNLPRF